MTARRTGRRPGDPEVTKRAILEAAKAVFGEVGFERATIRAIAARAAVDPSLVHHHFGSKQSLFITVHQLPVDPAQLIAGLESLPREQLAPQIIRLYLTVFGAPGSPAMSLVRAAATNDAAARMLREYVESVLLDNADRLVPMPDARLRITLLVSHLIGVLFARVVLGLADVTSLETEELVPILTPMVERYLFAPELAELQEQSQSS